MKSSNLKCFSLLQMALTCALIVGAAGAQRTQSYHFKSVDAPGSLYFTGILGINNYGDIAGVRDGAEGHAHGFIRVGSTYTTIDVPGATDTGAYNVTNTGEITGTFVDPLGFQHGFLLSHHHYTVIDAPGAAQIPDTPFEFGPGLGTAVIRMNDWGFLVGEYADAQGFSHGFVRNRQGRFQNVDVPGAGHLPGKGSEAVAINDFDVITGLYYRDDSPLGHGFILDHGRYTTVDYPGAGGTSGTQCNGINNFGEVVGPYSDVNDHLHG